MIVCCDIFSTYVNDYNRIIFMRDRQQQKRCYREKTEQKYGGKLSVKTESLYRSYLPSAVGAAAILLYSCLDIIPIWLLQLFTEVATI